VSSQPKARSAKATVFTGLPCNYMIREVPDPKGLVLLLHGWLQSGSYIFSKFEPLIPPEFTVLAMNALFPIPGRGEGHSRMGYSWYFYDSKKDEYSVGREPALTYLMGLIQQLGLEEVPKTLIGYSQGGYLAPFVAQRLPAVKQVIGVACEYLVEELEGELPFRVDAIHGAEDDVVSPALAQASFEKLQSRGVKGKFHLVEGVQHKITAPLQEKLQLVLAGLV